MYSFESKRANMTETYVQGFLTHPLRESPVLFEFHLLRYEQR
jgi:hypothetical protein